VTFTTRLLWFLRLAPFAGELSDSPHPVSESPARPSDCGRSERGNLVVAAITARELGGLDLVTRSISERR
jgi:hypothetical protein